MAKVLAIIGLGILLTACVSAPPNPLSVTDVQTLRLTRADVQVANPASLNIPDAEVQFLATNGVEATASGTIGLASSPDAKAFVADTAASRLKASAETALGGILAGSRPGRLNVTIRSVDLPSAGRRVLVGGANTIASDFVLVDAADGRELAAYRDFRTISTDGDAVLGVVVSAAVNSASGDDTYGRLLRSHTEAYARWLLHR